jgi:hypothetical protein
MLEYQTARRLFRPQEKEVPGNWKEQLNEEVLVIFIRFYQGHEINSDVMGGVSSIMG